MKDALVVFGENLDSVRFVEEKSGDEVDPRFVLSALAAGVAKVIYSEETFAARYGKEEEDFYPGIASQTWKIHFEDRGDDGRDTSRT